jgi:GxxExxY protein
MMEQRELSNRVIGLAIEVHGTVGPGLPEKVYQECMSMELAEAGIPFESEVMVPVVYKGRTIQMGFRADILVAEAIILEIKAVAAIVPAHEAQILTYLRMSGIRLGFIMNFNARTLKDGLLRCVM